MGKARNAWQDLKSQMEEAPKFGKDWVKQNFKQDLGPSLDAIEAACDAYSSEAEELQKVVAKMSQHQANVSKLASDVNQKFSSYAHLVKAKSAQEKTQHGAQIDGIIFQIKKAYINTYGPTQSKLMSTAKSVDALWHHKIG